MVDCGPLGPINPDGTSPYGEAMPLFDPRILSCTYCGHSHYVELEPKCRCCRRDKRRFSPEIMAWRERYLLNRIAQLDARIAELG